MAAMGEEVCRSCGACCASLRVGFHESETTRAGGRVPLAMTEPWIPKHVRMKGTAATPPRCAALEGEIGRATSCSIYGSHPEPCKALEPSTPDRPNPWCDEARARHGLAPLSQGAAPRRREKPSEKAAEKAAAQAAAQAAEPPAAPEVAPVAEPPKAEG